MTRSPIAESLRRLGAPLERCVFCERSFRPKTRTWAVHCRLVISGNVEITGGTIDTRGRPCCSQTCANALKQGLLVAPPGDWPLTDGPGADREVTVMQHRTNAHRPRGPKSAILVTGRGIATITGGAFGLL